VEERLRGTGVMAAARAGRLRTSWHVYNTEEDVEAALALLRPEAGRSRYGFE
jgi:selenocysteine lyase/cysteine desulfurase